MLEFVSFVPKPVLEIEAVEFTGGSEQGNELIEWIKGLGGSAEWHDADPGSHIRCGLKEHIKLLIGASAYMFVYVGDYVMFDEAGVFKPLSKGLADSRYDRVNRPVAVLPIKTESEVSQVRVA